jgi:RimJ/RimL family protein N-acetyltransferase
VQGRGLVTRASAALVDVARKVDGVASVHIHCDEANHRSAAVPVRLGFRLARVDDAPADSPAATGRQQIWVLDLDAADGGKALGQVTR